MRILLAAAQQPAPQLDVLMLFGFLAAFMTLVFYLHQRYGPGWVLMLAVGLVALTIYGLFSGAWLLSPVLAVASFETCRRWRRAGGGFNTVAREQMPAPRLAAESRMTRLFGSYGPN